MPSSCLIELVDGFEVSRGILGDSYYLNDRSSYYLGASIYSSDSLAALKTFARGGAGSDFVASNSTGEIGGAAA